ncbi:MAG: 50S ribosomal protein L19, partial [Campylobacterota bacterium]|nr:50S ribosomal protein L19 [Campylobacterota bacterium]
MRNKYIENFEKAQTSEKNIPDFRAGDTVRLAVTIKEGDKSRVQA